MYVFDSRNNSTKIEVPIGINYIDYKEKVIINKSCTRYANVNEESNLSFSGEWFNSSFGEYNNQLSATYKYRQKGGNEWIQGTTNINITVDGNTYSYSGYIKGDTNNGFATENSYEIEIIVTDSLSSKSDTTILIAGEPAMDIYHSNISIGGYYNEDESEAQYQSQFHKKTNFYSGVYKNGVEIATLNDISKIIESGSNTNGYYIKYENGIMFQYGFQDKGNINFTADWWGTFTRFNDESGANTTITFPLEFNEIYFCNLVPSSMNIINVDGNNKYTTTSATPYLICPKNNTGARNVQLFFFAIGTWK